MAKAISVGASPTAIYILSNDFNAIYCGLTHFLTFLRFCVAQNRDEIPKICIKYLFRIYLDISITNSIYVQRVLNLYQIFPFNRRHLKCLHCNKYSSNNNTTNKAWTHNNKSWVKTRDIVKMTQNLKHPFQMRYDILMGIHVCI